MSRNEKGRGRGPRIVRGGSFRLADEITGPRDPADEPARRAASRSTEERRGASGTEPMRGTQLLLPREMYERVELLVEALRRPRAEVLRRALEGGGVAGLERTYARELAAVTRRRAAAAETEEPPRGA